MRRDDGQVGFDTRWGYLMNAETFASWLANLLAGASPTGDTGIRIVVTDADNGSAEVLFESEWCYDDVVDVATLGSRLGIPISTLE